MSIADIVQTITIEPTLENATALGVLVRTFLSVSLERLRPGSERSLQLTRTRYPSATAPRHLVGDVVVELAH